MPEGPEVRSMFDYLYTFVGAKIKSVKLGSKFQGEFPDRGQTIEHVSVYGKHIYMYFTDNLCWHFTFGLKGNIRRKIEDEKWLVAGVRTVMGSFYYINMGYPIGKIETYYVDEIPDIEKPEKYGPDILDRNISYSRWCRALESKSVKRKLHVILLDQETIAGIGNYLKSEILYHSRLHPMRTVDSLTDKECRRLYNSSMLLIREAYNCKGLTISDYLTPYGERGTYEPKVYQKERDPRGRKVIKEQLGGRGTFWVAEVQRLD
jgi:formamidopyrimidine-DNA glycosylase